MSLTGIDPNDPIPSIRRELVFASGASSGVASSRPVLIYGNKTSAGSESVNTIGTPIVDDADAIARFGRRSEWYNMYRKYVAVDPQATIYGIAPTESGGSAASVDFTFATTATASSTVKVEFQGESVEAAVDSGDTAIDIAAAVAAAINAAAEGTWQATATVGANPNEHVVTVTCSQKGPRGDLLLGSGTNRGMRMRFTKDCTTTVAKGSLTGGTTEDDFTSAYSEAANSEYYYQVSPKHAVATVTASDNGIGEHIDMVRTGSLPANGKAQLAIFGLVGTQSQASAVAISSAANSVFARFFWQENSDWSPGMLAAHHAAVLRSQEIADPAANINGYTATDSTIYQVPAPFLKADIPTQTEIRACLNDGVCPIGLNKAGAPTLIRHVTSRSLNAQGNKDYRAREGHVTSVMHFFWDQVLQRWEAEKQPNVSDDPPEGGKPLPGFSTPSQLQGLIRAVIDDLAGPRPLGQYNRAILSPDRVTEAKRSVVVSRGNGSLSAAADVFAVQHLIKTEVTARETSPAY